MAKKRKIIWNIRCKRLLEDLYTLMHLDSNIIRDGIKNETVVCIKC